LFAIGRLGVLALKQFENAAGSRNLLTTSILSVNKKLNALSTRL